MGKCWVYMTVGFVVGLFSSKVGCYPDKVAAGPTALLTTASGIDKADIADIVAHSSTT